MTGLLDGAAALPYIGDDPAQVALFQESVDTARGFMSVFNTDVDSARSATRTAWSAAEADLADQKTGTLVESGLLMTGRLEAGNRAAGAYGAVLVQGRRAVDAIREQWDRAPARNGMTGPATPW